MDWHAALGFGAGAVQFASAIPYIRDILWGTTRPNIVSYALWVTLGLIEIFAQYSAGASWSIIIPIVLTFNMSIVLVLGCFGYGYKKYSFIDGVCLLTAAAALLVWYETGNPTLALITTMVASICASLPTAVKTYKEPYSEDLPAWVMNMISATMAAASSTLWNIPNLIFPVYAFIEAAIISSLMVFGRLKKPRKTA